MPKTMESPANLMNGVDYFKAKLQFEATPHSLRSMMTLPSVLVLDVRERQAYEKEHIPKAVNIPLEGLPRRLKELPKEKTIVCYCWTLTCALATKAALELAHKGYKVQELVGGIAEWKKTGFEIEGAAAQETRGEAQY